MPLFHKEGQTLSLIRPKSFVNEKELQNLIELNLKEIFYCKFIASEFYTGQIHGGRIDTLALSEENNPVIIEYKNVESSQLINQSLFYLSWLNDHKGDFEVTVRKKLNSNDVEVDWSNIRVICIAPDFKKYDLHAVQMMGSNIELWQYRYYENELVFFEEVFKKSVFTDSTTTLQGKNPVMVEAGKKAAITRSIGVYTFEEHLIKISNNKKSLVTSLQDFILNIDDSIEEVPKKFYVAYKVSQNFVCMEIQKNKITLYLKIDPSQIDNIPLNGRDVKNIGHYGTGDFELTITNEQELNDSKNFIITAYNNIGGN